MRRLLLSLGAALLVGGVAMAANADQPFRDQPGSELSARQSPADRPLGTSDLPLADLPTVQPTIDGGAAGQPGAPREPACRLEEVLVKFKPDADPATVAGRHGASITSSIPQIGVYVLTVTPGTQAAALAGLAADPDVEYAEPNGVVSAPELPLMPDPCAGPPTAP